MLLIATKDAVLTRRFRQQLHGAYAILEFSDLKSLRLAMPRLRPVAAFVDLDLIGRDRMPLVRSRLRRYWRIPFIAIGSTTEEELPLLHAGFRGVVNRGTPPSLYPKMIAAVLGGEMWFMRRSICLFLEALGLIHAPDTGFVESASALSARELQVAKIAMRGASNRMIADSLGITERTVKAHVTNILGKLGLTHRTELFQLEERLLQPASLSSETPQQPDSLV